MGWLTRVIDWDVKTSELLAVSCCSDESSILRNVMFMMEWSLHGIPWVVCTLLALIFVENVSSLQFIFNLMIGLMLDLLVCGIAKTGIQRKRPDWNADDMTAGAPYADQFSCPSGHSTRVAMLTVILLHLEGESMHRYSLWLVLLFPFLIAISRVVLGRHFLLDVMLGLFLGSLEGCLVVFFWVSADSAVECLQPFKQLLPWHRHFHPSVNMTAV